MKQILLLILFVLCTITVLISCNERLENTYQQEDTIFCISKELSECIQEYICDNEYKIALYNENGELWYPIYYTLYFFNEDTSNYFTIWEFVIPISPFDKNLLTDTSILYYRILERDVFIINDVDKENNVLFSSCNDNILLGKEKQNIENFPIYDGSIYPATYRYYNNNKNIIIEKMDTTLLHFISGWAEYEKYIKEKQNKRN